MLFRSNPSELIFKPLPSDDPCRRMPDLTQAKLQLNWQAKVSLKEGLVKTVAYFAAEMERMALANTTRSVSADASTGQAAQAVVTLDL